MLHESEYIIHLHFALLNNIINNITEKCYDMYVMTINMVPKPLHHRINPMCLQWVQIGPIFDNFCSLGCSSKRIVLGIKMKLYIRRIQVKSQTLS